MAHRRWLAAIMILALAAAAQAREIKDYSSTIAEFKKVPKVAPYFDSAYGYAVFASIGKGGLGIGAAHGKGQTYLGGKVTGFTALTDVSLGLQAGGQAYSQVIFFENRAAYETFTSGNFEFDAGAGAVVVTASAAASAGTGGAEAGASSGTGGAKTTAGYRKGMLIFTMPKGGLMAEITIAGQKYSWRPVR